MVMDGQRSARIFALKSGTFLVSAAALSMLFTAPAVAQEEEPAAGQRHSQETLDEIVVTARQRGETLLEVPVAVTAIGAAELQQFGTTDIRDISKLAPSLSIDRSGSGNGGIVSLRGVSTSSGQVGFDQAVAIEVDGVMVGRARILAQGLFDVGQIEVLKGPQALFFGKNSPGGVISIKSAGPTDELEGYIRSSYEFVGDEALVEGAISGPLTEEIGARLALRYRDLKGYFFNTSGGYTDATYPFAAVTPPPGAGKHRAGEKEFVGRLTLSYKPVAADLDATLKLSIADQSGDGPAYGAQPIYCDGVSAGVTYGVLDPYGECKFDKYFSRGSFNPAVVENMPFMKVDPYTDIRMYLGGLTVNYNFGDLTLTSVSGYFKYTSKTADNYDATSLNQLYSAEREGYRALSQELRLLSDFDGPLNFLLGAYYQDTSLDFDTSVGILGLGPDAEGRYHTWERSGYTDGKTYSVFGQLIWDVTDHVELAGGVRYTREKKDSSMRHIYARPELAGTLLAPTTRVFADRFRDSNYSPEVTLTYRPTTDLTAYVAYKTGYKSGGFGLSVSLIPATITEDAITYDSEKVKGFEAGLKAQLFDGRLTLSTALYNYKYDNLQVNSFNADTTSFTINNAASARVKGVEAEAQFRLNDVLRVYGAVAYNHARYLDYLTGCYNTQTFATGCNVLVANGADGVAGTADDVFGQDLTGKPLSRAPDWAISAGFDATVPVSSAMNFVLAGNARYSDSYSGVENGNPRGVQPSFWLFDASARLASADDTWSIALIGRNLGNKFYSGGYLFEKPGASGLNQIAGTPSRGRQVLVELGYNF